MWFRFTRVRGPGARGLTLVELCVIGAILVLGVGAVLPAMRTRTYDRSDRVKCASNLRQIGQGIQMYANENKGNFPRTIYDPAAAATPTEYTGWQASNPFNPGGPGPNDVTAALFLLLRTQDLTPEVFVCPSSAGEWDLGGRKTQAMSNFPNGRYLTYSYINPYPTPEVVKAGFKLNYTLTSDFAIAADINPGAPGVTSVTPTSARRQMAAGNSGNHNGDGQNILYADGHAEFQNTPFCGMQRLTDRPANGYRDNIYTYGAGHGATTAGVGVKGPAVDPLDSVLLPVTTFGAAIIPGQSGGGPVRWHFVAVGAAAMFGVVVLIAMLIRRRDTAPPPQM